MQKITPFLWLDSQAEEAVRFYTSVFTNSGIGHIARYSEESAGPAGRPPGSVMTISFQLHGHEFVALNGGPHFEFNESVSFVVNCETQEEVDYYWEKLGENGDPKARQCGWLKDKFGVSWQVVPVVLEKWMMDEDRKKPTACSTLCFR